MKNVNFKSSSACFSIVFLPIALAHGLNYLDPGTGSLIIQIIIGALIAGGYVIKSYWLRIMLFLSKRFNKAMNDDIAQK